MYPEFQYKDREIQKRINQFYNDHKTIYQNEVSKYREKLCSLSEFMKDIKQCFTRKYNKENKRRGFFWGQRFKSVIVENGETLINCLAYIDLNPVRANIVEKPEDYRWNTLGYLLQTKNKDKFLTLEFGVPGEEKIRNQVLAASLAIQHNKYMSPEFQFYRRFVYESSTLPTPRKSIAKEQEHLSINRKKDYQITRIDNFRYRTRYFTDSGVIGSKKFVKEHYQLFKEYFDSKKEKKPLPIKGLS
jgi:putative transposase